MIFTVSCCFEGLPLAVALHVVAGGVVVLEKKDHVEPSLEQLELADMHRKDPLEDNTDYIPKMVEEGGKTAADDGKLMAVATMVVLVDQLLR